MVIIVTGRRKKEKKKETKQQPKNREELMSMTVKELEKAFYSVRFYPVAVKEDAKNDGIRKIREMYEEGDDAVKQLMLYMTHEYLSSILQFKIMHNFEFFKSKNPKIEPGQLRMDVYRGMFNYNTSMEGIIEILKLLGELKGNADDAAKVLTYHFTFLGTGESEANRVLRNTIIEALGNSQSKYALKSLIDYAKYSDDHMLLSRIAEALEKWDNKIDDLQIPVKEKKDLKKEMKGVLVRDKPARHYG